MDTNLLRRYKYLKINRKELRELLNIKESTLKQYINNNKLEHYLNNKGYKLIDTIKEGRSNFYIIEKLEIDIYTYYYDTIKCTYNVNDNNDSFTKYYPARTLTNGNIPISSKNLANYCGVSQKTINRWDNKLIELNIMSKDGFYYFCIDYDNKDIKQVSKEEYSSYWRNCRAIKEYKNIEELFNNGTYTLRDVVELCTHIAKSESAIQGNKYYYRIKKYKTNAENNLYVETMDIIKMLYDDVYIKPINSLIEYDRNKNK